MLVDVPAVLTALGVEFDDLGAECRALCPMHFRRTGREDHTPSWFINQDTGRHICFSCGYKGNLVQLVCDINEFYVTTWDKVTGYDYRAAESWIASVSEVPIERLIEMFTALPTYITSDAKPLEMSEARLAVFDAPPADALESRKISAESAAKYGVLWDSKTKTWILPLREPQEGKLLGWQEKGTIHRTFFNRPAGLKKSKTMFGVTVQNPEQVVVVESPLDCVRLDTIGVEGAVALCGSSLSEEQAKLLRASEYIIAAFDQDAAGMKANKEMLQWSRKYGLNLSFFNYGVSSAKDPGEMSDEEIFWGIAHSKSALYGESAYVPGDTKTVSG